MICLTIKYKLDSDKKSYMEVGKKTPPTFKIAGVYDYRCYCYCHRTCYYSADGVHC